MGKSILILFIFEKKICFLFFFEYKKWNTNFFIIFQFPRKMNNPKIHVCCVIFWRIQLNSVRTLGVWVRWEIFQTFWHPFVSRKLNFKIFSGLLSWNPGAQHQFFLFYPTVTVRSIGDVRRFLTTIFNATSCVHVTRYWRVMTSQYRVTCTLDDL